jgi:ElaB/YqjD/DUF883 family membrane-anchored ribosome-binding protein
VVSRVTAIPLLPSNPVTNSGGGYPTLMAEPLKKNDVSPQPDTPQPFRNQELREDGRSIDSAPTPSEPPVGTSSSNVVELKPSTAIRAEDFVAATSESALDSAARKYREAQQTITEAAEWARGAAVEGADRAGRRFRYWADEYPLQLLAAVAGIGFVAGALLRIWRSTRYEQ